MAALSFQRGFRISFALIGNHTISTCSEARAFNSSCGAVMRSKESETLLLLPLLPIFLLGMFPILVLGLLGFAGLCILGVLVICAGLADGLDANGDFNRQVIVGGYAPHSERVVAASVLHAAIRSATVTTAAGAALTTFGVVGFLCFD